MINNQIFDTVKAIDKLIKAFNNSLISIIRII